ncbi:MAG: class A beta-lactamase [Alphaproteobacteria bacterium]|nr:class A beta-lactamase [Alphaproteobacteria bacterium]
MRKSNGLGRFVLTRRDQLKALLPLAAAMVLPGRSFAASASSDDAVTAFEALELREGGRLGVMVLDTGTGARTGYRADELFLLCSTFKFVLGAAILQGMDAGRISLDREIPVSADDMVGMSPVTEQYIGRSMTVGELCHATITQSDNPAANLLIREIGGPQSVTDFLRALGDSVTRLDRYEPHLNAPNVAAGDKLDTTSPAAMADTMQKIVLGEVLTPASREIMIGWLKATVTGPDRLRRGLPEDWAFGHKTGTGEDGPTNDIGITWPPDRPPLVVTVYYDRQGRTMKENATVLAEVGRIVGRFV